MSVIPLARLTHELGIWRRWDRTRWKDDNDEALRAAAIIARWCGSA